MYITWTCFDASEQTQINYTYLNIFVVESIHNFFNSFVRNILTIFIYYFEHCSVRMCIIRAFTLYDKCEDLLLTLVQKTDRVQISQSFRDTQQWNESSQYDPGPP